MPQLGDLLHMRHLVLISALLLLTACGQKGALYLPGNSEEAVERNDANNDQLVANQREQDK